MKRRLKWKKARCETALCTQNERRHNAAQRFVGREWVDDSPNLDQAKC